VCKGGVRWCFIMANRLLTQGDAQQAHECH
jgi:hypothetical protein